MNAVELASDENRAIWKAPQTETSPTVVAAKENATQKTAEGRAFQQMMADMEHENAGVPLTPEKITEFNAVAGATHEAVRGAEDATDDASLLEGLQRGGRGMGPYEMVKAASLAIDAGDTQLLANVEKALSWQVPARVEERLRDEFHSREMVRTLNDVIQLGERNPAFAEEMKIAKTLLSAKIAQA